MLALVNNLLDLRRLETQEGFLVFVPTAVRGLVEEAVAMTSPLIENKGHRLTVDIPDDLPEVQADPRAVVRILVNLISNAVKYTAARGHLEISARAEDSLVRVAVRDSGIGVAPHDQARIFNYFEQVRSPYFHETSGSGIGLALCRELIEQMGGRIGLVSSVGVGSTFFFLLPVYDSGSAPMPAGPAPVNPS
jgi:signal transduction histidine kinase